MNRPPLLWRLAYGSRRRPAVVRLLARWAVRCGARIRELAVADHGPSVML